MRLTLVMTLVMVPVVALAGELQGTDQVLFGCTVTKYERTAYMRNEILGKDMAIMLDGFEACIEKCLLTHGCKAINLVDGKGCQPLISGIHDANKAVMGTDYAKANSVDHAFISCPEHEASDPVGCGKVTASCHKPPARMAVHIINGQEVKPHCWPWQVYLEVDIGPTRISICGASLIRVKPNVEESDILVTAAHCITHGYISENLVYSPEKVSVFAGSHHVNKYEVGEQVRKAAQFLAHPDYKVHRHDIALVKLDKPVKFTDTIRPICLPTQGEALPVGKKCAVAGWGRISSTSNDTSKTLQELDVPVHSAADCKQNDHGGWGPNYFENEMICAGSLKGDAGVCEGDSGGMLACQQDDGRWTLYGATSHGVENSCLEPGTPGMFTRVSSYVDWIKENMATMTSM